MDEKNKLNENKLPDENNSTTTNDSGEQIEKVETFEQDAIKNEVEEVEGQNKSIDNQLNNSSVTDETNENFETVEEVESNDTSFEENNESISNENKEDDQSMNGHDGDGFNGSRVEKNQHIFNQINNAKLWQAVLIAVVVISLFANIFMFTKINNTTGSTSNGGSVQKVNYDVKSSTTDVINDVLDSVVGVLVYSNGVASGSGSGVVYRVSGKDAYIITNAHVVEGSNNVQVVFTNGESVEATVLGSDSYSDIAVLKLTADFDLTAINCGDSSLLDRGETVLAIGSPLGIEYAGTVTQGIVSGTDRTVSVDLNEDGQDDWDMSVIQTDAAINPGNSGGALVNMAGELVGITSMKLSDTSVEGMGFALPINDVVKNVEQIIESGKVARPQFGISGLSLSGYSSFQLRYYRINTDLTDGIYVASVSAGGPASQAGIIEGDIIVEFDGKKITTYKSFLTALYAKEPGDKVSVVVNRNGQEKNITVTLGEQ